MPYTKTTWADRVVQYPGRFTRTSDGTYDTLTPAPGTVTTAGTPLTASSLNNLEKQYDSAMADVAAITYYTPTLYNGWTTNGTGVTQYYKDADGVVHVDFCIQGGALGANNAFIILPSGYRPANNIAAIAYCDGASPASQICQIQTTGNLQFLRNLPTNSLVIGNFAFKAGN